MSASAVRVNVDVGVPGIAKFVGDNATVSCDESTELVSDPLPANPPNGTTVMTELLDEAPATTVREKGSAESVKPAPVTVTVMSIE